MSEEQSEIQKLKEAHDYYVTTVEILSQRIQFYAEEFDAVKNMIAFFKQMAMDLRLKIQSMEPTKEAIDGQENGATEGAPV